MARNGALHLAPNTQACLFLRSGIVSFAPAGAVFIEIIKLRCLTSLWCVHWLTNSHARMGRYKWHGVPRKCLGNAMGNGTQIQQGLCPNQSNYLFQVDILPEFD